MSAHVALDHLANGRWVTTVQLDDGYETRIFDSMPSNAKHGTRRYATLAEALEGHRWTVNQINSGFLV